MIDDLFDLDAKVNLKLPVQAISDYGLGQTRLMYFDGKKGGLNAPKTPIREEKTKADRNRKSDLAILLGV